MTPEAVEFIRTVMAEKVDEIISIPLSAEKEPSIILEEVEESYLQELSVLKANIHTRDLKIVYTPLHGTGLVPIETALNQFGYKSVFIEKEQAIQDGNFPTVTVPNPEERIAFERAAALGHKQSADILIATDPDADRLGVAILHEGDYHYLTGNQLGALLLFYKLQTMKENNKLPKNGVAIKTIVTSELGKAIANHFDVEMEDTLTGFKYISEKIETYETTGEKTFLFGYEESYGYLLEAFARDKDAIQAAVAACELTQLYKEQGLTLVDALENLYKKFGFFKENLLSIELDPLSGSEEVTRLMTLFKEPTEKMKKDLQVKTIENYELGIKTHQDGKTEPLTLPKENVVKYILDNNNWICFRPSGTEPKMKIYFGVRESSHEESIQKMKMIESSIRSIL